MTKILQSLGVAAMLTIASQANAQLPDNGVYPGGLMLTEFGGGPTHDIDAILDSGKPVIIDMFAVWCGPCWNYHQAGTLEDVYNNIGDGGTGQVAIFAVEADGSTPESSMDGGGNSIGDWIAGTAYPMSNNNSIASMMNLAYYPTLLLICPDRTVTEVGQTTEAGWVAAVNNCGTAATSTNDPRMLANNSVSNVDLCGAATATTPIKVVVQNYSTAAINGSYTIEATIGATVVATTTTTLNLQPYAATEVNVGNASLSLGVNNVVVTITTNNDDLTNDDISVPVTVQQAVDLGIGDIMVKATFDGYGSEFGYGLATGTVANTDLTSAYSQFNGGTYPGQFAFKPFGTYTNGTSNMSAPYTGLAAGCYHLYVFDSYGDGLSVGSNGALSLSSPNSSIVQNYSENYGDGTWKTFEITEAGTGGFAGIEAATAVEFAKVFPNPAVDMTNLQFNLNQASNVTVEMYNAMGQIVYSNTLGEVNGFQNVEISTSDLESGVYLLNVNVDGNVITKTVSVAK